MCIYVKTRDNFLRCAWCYFFLVVFFSNCAENSQSPAIPVKESSSPVEIADTTEHTKEPSHRFNPNFEVFLKQFINDVYSGKAFSRLVATSSPIFKVYIDESLGFGRFWNAGIYCNLYSSEGYGYDGPHEINRDISGLKFFPNKTINEGVCEPSTSRDGVYYKEVTDLPKEYNMDLDAEVPVPKKYKSLKKMNVQILLENWIVKDLYFVQWKEAWYLIYIDDCDCSI
jgi:hypothetical protein